MTRGVTTATTATWATIEALLIDRHGGKRAIRDRIWRGYRVPSPSGGSFLVEVKLGRRWCAIGIDRWQTTDRSDETNAWLYDHIRPIVMLAHNTRRGTGMVPSGRTYAIANPIERADLLDVLTAWVDAELANEPLEAR